jgi:RimJ/RimL family protein N-acetyltransferase
MIPQIESERLVLRGMCRDDFPRFAEIWREPSVVRYIGNKPRSDSESWGAFLRIAGSWALEGFGQWAIVRKADGQLVGQTGFFNAMRGLGEDFDAAPEAGWVIATAAQGKGYGPEAVRAAHRWYDFQSFAGRSNCMIEVGHAASFRIAEDLGYRPLREIETDGDKVVLMTRVAPGGAR